jgi:hypothetical protein
MSVREESAESVVLPVPLKPKEEGGVTLGAIVG